VTSETLKNIFFVVRLRDERNFISLFHIADGLFFDANSEKTKYVL
jgi:hypothetical protein